MSDAAASILSLCLLCCCCSYLCWSACVVISLFLGDSSYADQTDFWKKTLGLSAGGPWKSKVYGNQHRPIGGDCPAGSFVTDVIGFSGQGDHTNALQFWCYDPSTQKTSRIFKKPTCGKRDKPDPEAIALLAFTPIVAIAATALTIFPGTQPLGALAWTGLAVSVAGTAAWAGMEIASGIDAAKDILKPGKGRSLWPKIAWTGAPAGYYKWNVRPKDNEIKGLNLYAIDGQRTGWIGGMGSENDRFGAYGPRKKPPTDNVITQRCPPGTIITGVTASCGDRVDGIQFTCDRPPGM